MYIPPQYYVSTPTPHYPIIDNIVVVPFDDNSLDFNLSKSGMLFLRNK